jgi:hypothetical protein
MKNRKGFVFLPKMKSEKEAEIKESSKEIVANTPTLQKMFVLDIIKWLIIITFALVGLYVIWPKYYFYVHSSGIAIFRCNEFTGEIVIKAKPEDSKEWKTITIPP